MRGERAGAVATLLLCMLSPGDGAGADVSTPSEAVAAVGSAWRSLRASQLSMSATIDTATHRERQVIHQTFRADRTYRPCGDAVYFSGWRRELSGDASPAGSFGQSLYEGDRRLLFSLPASEDGRPVSPSSVPLERLGMTLRDPSIAEPDGLSTSLEVAMSLDQVGLPTGRLGKTDLVAMLAEGTIENAEVKAGVAVIDVRSPQGLLSVEATADDGWFPRSFVLQKNGGDRLVDGDTRMSSVRSIRDFKKGLRSMRGGAEPAERRGLTAEEKRYVIESLVWTAKASDFDFVDAVGHVPRTFQVEKESTFAGGFVDRRKTQARITDASPADVGDCGFDPAPPIGTRVTVSGARHLPYKWDGAQVVPVIDPIQDAMPADAPRLVVGRRDNATSYLFYSLLAVCVLAGGVAFYIARVR